MNSLPIVRELIPEPLIGLVYSAAPEGFGATCSITETDSTTSINLRDFRFKLKKIHEFQFSAFFLGK